MKWPYARQNHKSSAARSASSAILWIFEDETDTWVSCVTLYVDVSLVYAFNIQFGKKTRYEYSKR